MASGLFGVGVDAIEVSRVRRLLGRLPAAEERLFTAQEREYCRRYADPVPRLAARFASKEAVAKALGTGVIDWQEIEVVGGGRPAVRLHGATAMAAGHLGITRIELSLTHTAGQAIAVAAALKEDQHG